MDNVAPIPSEQTPAPKTVEQIPIVKPQKESSMLDAKNPSGVSVTIAGCGGKIVA